MHAGDTTPISAVVPWKAPNCQWALENARGDLADAVQEAQQVVVDQEFNNNLVMAQPFTFKGYIVHVKELISVIRILPWIRKLLESNGNGYFSMAYLEKVFERFNVHHTWIHHALDYNNLVARQAAWQALRNTDDKGGHTVLLFQSNQTHLLKPPQNFVATVQKLHTDIITRADVLALMDHFELTEVAVRTLLRRMGFGNKPELCYGNELMLRSGPAWPYYAVVASSTGTRIEHDVHRFVLMQADGPRADLNDVWEYLHNSRPRMYDTVTYEEIAAVLSEMHRHTCGSFVDLERGVVFVGKIPPSQLYPGSDVWYLARSLAGRRAALKSAVSPSPSKRMCKDRAPPAAAAAAGSSSVSPGASVASASSTEEAAASGSGGGPAASSSSTVH